MTPVAIFNLVNAEILFGLTNKHFDIEKMY